MGTGIFFLIQAMFYTGLLLIIYFNKKRLKNTENKVYNFLIVVSAIELSLELILDYVGPQYESMPQISFFIAKLYCCFLQLWITNLCMYIVIIALNMKNKSSWINVIKKSFWIIFIIFSIMIFILPLKFYYSGTVSYTYGLSVNIVYVSSMLFSVIGIICLLWNLSNIKDKRFLPLLAFLILGGGCSLLQYSYPELLLAVPVHAFITFLMYFTIENPDMQMIDELIKTKDIADKTNENKSLFIYNIVQGLRNPISNIKEAATATKDEKDKNEVHENLNYIISEANKTNVLINNALDISNVNKDNIKVYKSEYDIKLLTREISLKYKNNIPTGVDFRLSVSDDVPDSLYGDSVRIKQVLCSLLNNSISNTSVGYIELTIAPIIKQDVCRLVITLEDSGSGMELDKVNNILKMNTDSDFNLDLIDNLNVSLPIIKKIIDFLGGMITIESEVKKGTKVTIVLDQKIPNEESKFLYNNLVANRKKLLVIDKESDTISTKTENVFYENNIKASYAQYGIYALEKIRNKEIYDLIIINDNIEKIECFDVVDKIINIEKYKGKIVVIGPSTKANLYQNTKIFKYIDEKTKQKDIVSIVLEII